MKIRKHAYLLVLGLVLVFSTIIALEKYQDYQHIANQKASIEKKKNLENTLNSKSLADLRSRLFTVSRYNTPVPIQEWESLPKLYDNDSWYINERNRFADLAKDRDYDVIVLPIQEYNASVDRVSRILPARLLSDEIARRTNLKVMPVELFLRSLGERSFRFGDRDIESLAKKHGVSSIIHLYLNTKYDGLDTRLYNYLLRNPKEYSINVVMTESGNLVKNIAYRFKTPDATTPIEMLLHEHIPDIVSRFMPEAKKSDKKIAVNTDTPPHIPKKLSELLQVESSPIQQAFNLQLLGAFTSKNMIYERRRLFERSLVILENIDEESKYVRLLKARALTNLFRRPAALKILATTNTREERAFIEYLNGNYAALKTLTKELDEGLIKLLSYIELMELKNSYDIDENINIKIALPNTQWDTLVESQSRDSDIWYAPDNFHFFRRLNGLFSNFDTAYNAVYLEKNVAGSLSEQANTESLLFENAWDRLWAEIVASSCCELSTVQITELDLAMFYRNLGISNIIRDLKKKFLVQASYHRGLDTAKTYETIFNGYISLTSLIAKGYSGLARKSHGSERTNLVANAKRYAEQTIRLVGGTDFDASNAGLVLWELTQLGEKRIVVMQQHLGPSALYYDADSPTKYIQDYRNTITNLDSLTGLLDTDVHGLDTEVLEKELTNRFDGHPDKINFLVERHQKKNDITEAIQLLKDEISKGTRAWQPYWSLGKFMLFDGLYDDAFNAFMQYPPFLEKDPKNRVAVSNHAYLAGSKLFWLGKPDLAVPLYKIAVDLRTGAGGELASAQRLAMLDGKYSEAAYYAYKRGARYNDIFGYRDYLAFLYLLGYPEQAHAGFIELSPRFSEPQLWTAIFIGHRSAGIDNESLLNWMLDFKNNFSGNNVLIEQLERYAFLQSFIDRPIVNPDENIFKTAWQYRKPFDRQKIYGINRFMKYFDKSVSENDFIPDSRIEYLPSGEPISVKIEPRIMPNYFDTIYKAYALLKEKKYAESYQAFLDNFRNYGFGSLPDDPQIFMHPYFSIAAIKSGNEVNLYQYFKANITLQEEAFDYHLSKAAISAIKGESDQALLELEHAFNARPHTMERPVYTWYQIVELCEWIYEETGDQKFIDKALQWSKDYQIIQPQFAWAYSFEAKYSKNHEDRIRATAFSLYLDPQSYWLGSVPEEIKEKAKMWWKSNNPFRKSNDGPGI